MSKKSAFGSSLITQAQKPSINNYGSSFSSNYPTAPPQANNPAPAQLGAQGSPTEGLIGAPRQSSAPSSTPSYPTINLGPQARDIPAQPMEQGMSALSAMFGQQAQPQKTTLGAIGSPTEGLIGLPSTGMPIPNLGFGQPAQPQAAVPANGGGIQSLTNSLQALLGQPTAPHQQMETQPQPQPQPQPTMTSAYNIPQIDPSRFQNGLEGLLNGNSPFQGGRFNMFNQF